MSTQKGNISRTRPQQHQNKTRYKNDLHDKSYKVKLMNTLEIDKVCSRCKDIIEWKIKYKKYKPLKYPATCVKCRNKNVKHAYHALCSECCKNLNVCPKCQLNKELVTSTSVKTVEELLQSSEIQGAIKSLSERRRRSFYRQLKKPTFNLNKEEEILNKIKEMSLGTTGEDAAEECSDDLEGLDSSESNGDDSVNISSRNK